MKRILILFVVLLSISAIDSIAQSNVDVQSCLHKRYSDIEIQGMSLDELDFEKYYVENVIQVLPEPEGKPEGTFETRKLKVNTDVCIYDLDIEVKEGERTYFISKNNMLVMIYSAKEIINKYERNK